MVPPIRRSTMVHLRSTIHYFFIPRTGIRSTSNYTRTVQKKPQSSSRISNSLHPVRHKRLHHLIDPAPSSTVAINTLLLPTAIHSTIDRNSPHLLTRRRDGTQLTIAHALLWLQARLRLFLPNPQKSGCLTLLYVFQKCLYPFAPKTR